MSQVCIAVFDNVASYKLGLFFPGHSMRNLCNSCCYKESHQDPPSLMIIALYMEKSNVNGAAGIDISAPS